MTAAVCRNAAPALSVPQTQNTAPVLEFNCLYTHDVRRKAKRWQDGFLRYHTFNKRVMVYDVPRNYIGDTHWTDDGQVADGDELMLDKAGVLVQVAEAVGRTETDLTELLASTKKTRGDGSSPARASRTPVVPSPSNGVLSKQPYQLKHRNLNALLGASRTPIGKAALPSKSPFALRHENAENEMWEEGKPPKRQQVESSGAWNVTRTTSAAKAPSKELPLWARTADAARRSKKPQLQPGQQKLSTRELIDLCGDDPKSDAAWAGISSDTLPPRSSSRRVKTPVRGQPAAEFSSPAFETQKVTAKLQDASRSKRAATESRDTVRDEPIHNDFIVLDGSDDGSHSIQPRKLPRQRSMIPEAIYGRGQSVCLGVSDQLQSSEVGSTLPMAAGMPKKIRLLCQDQLTSPPKRVSSTNTEAAADRLLGAASDGECDQPSRTTKRARLQERLAKIDKKGIARRSKAKEQQRNRVESPKHDKLTVDASFIESEGNLTCSPQHAAQVNDRSIELAELDKIIKPTVTVARNTKATNDTDDASENLSAVEPNDGESAQQPALRVQSRSPPTKKAARKKVGKRDIRASAAACVRPPKPIELPRLPAPQDDGFCPRPAPKSGVASTSPSKPERILGAPMRLTPSPFKGTKQSAFNPSVRHATSPDPTRPTPPVETVILNQQAPTTPPRNATPPARNAKTNKKVPATPVRRATPPAELADPDQQSPARHAQDATQTVQTAPSGERATTMFPPPRPAVRSASGRGLQKTVGLNTAASGTATVTLRRPFQPPKQTAVSPGKTLKKAVAAETATTTAPTVAPAPAEPWSREAFDLFGWRPPGWDEEGWCFNDTEVRGEGSW